MFMIPFRRETAVRPAESFNALEKDFAEVLQVLNNGAFTAPAHFVPVLDLRETKDAFTLQLDLPGLDKKNIQVRLAEGVLTVSGERKASHQEAGEDSWHRVERGWGSFERSVRLGDSVDEARVSAEYKDGVLEITVPKKESALPRMIEVR
jgi:HSP20 family protein